MSASGRCSDNVDLNQFIFKATSQIPKGMVSTYGDIAKALGDVRASRAVGTVLANNPRPIVVPCHRVVYSDGRTGWYDGKGKGAERKIELLRGEGVRISEGAVEDFEKRRFADFKIPRILENLKKEQEGMRARVVERDDYGELRFVAGLDVSYSLTEAFGSMVIFDLRKMKKVEERTARCETNFPYIPGYLGYRETPIAKKLIVGNEDMVYLIDGQGALHPRGFGVACQIGVCLDVPTIGAAKSLLCGTVAEDEGEKARVLVDGGVRGYELRKRHRKKVYVSVGNRISLGTATDLCSQLMVNGVPEPQRQAHILATSERKKHCAGDTE